MAESRLDHEGKVVRGCVLFGSKESKNNYRYSEQAVQTLHKMAAGAKVYIDHESDADKRARQGVRSMQNFAGVIGNVQRRGDKLLGDWSVTENYWPLAKDIATMVPDRVGFSIACRAYTSTENGLEVIEDLHSLSSIDCVSEGAVIQNLFEGLHTRREVQEKDPYKVGSVIEIRESEILIDAGGSSPLYIEKRKLDFIPRLGQDVALIYEGTKEKQESKKPTKEVEKNHMLTVNKEIAKGLEVLGRKSEQEDFEEALLDVVDTHRSPKITTDPDLYSHLPAEAPKHTGPLTEETVLEAASARAPGIEHGSGDASQINEFQSPEARWNRRVSELRRVGRPEAKTRKTEKSEADELLAAVTKK
jgi:hypothetical protein